MPRRVCLILLASFLHGQDKPARPTFEVASIKPSKPGALNGGMKAMPGGQVYRAENVSLKFMLSLMYYTQPRLISGGPAWLDDDKWDIEAKADRPCTMDQLREMFRNLLEDEFKLKVRKDAKEGPVYVLSIDKAGMKMKVNDTPPDFAIPIGGGPGVAIAKRIWMARFCWYLEQVLERNERPVIDRTGLTGFYDFTLNYMPEFPPYVDRDRLPPEILSLPSIFEALRTQLGLKLEAQKGPVIHYTIDSAMKPEN